jgi:hypothetical protein
VHPPFLIFLSEAAFASCALSALRFCVVDLSAQTNRAVAVSVPSTPALSYPTLSVPALSDPALSVPTPSAPAPSVPTLSDPALSDSALSVPTLSDPALSDPAPSVPALSVSYPVPSPLDFPLRTISIVCSSGGYQNICDISKVNQIARIIKD